MVFQGRSRVASETAMKLSKHAKHEASPREHRENRSPVFPDTNLGRREIGTVTQTLHTRARTQRDEQRDQNV